MVDTNPPQLIVIMTSFGKLEDAKLMAYQLLDQHLVACVQITRDVHSIYRWQGKLCEETEVVLSAKTQANKWHELREFIKDNHPYELPELIAITPTEYDQAYGQWIDAEVNSN